MDELKKLLENAGISEAGIENLRRVRIEDVFSAIKKQFISLKNGGSITVKIKDAGKILPMSVFQYEITVDDDSDSDGFPLANDVPSAGEGMGDENTLGNDHNPKYKWPGDMP